MRCPFCKNKLPSQSQFCPNCGKKLPKQSNKKRIIILILLILIVLLMGVGIFFLVKNTDQNKTVYKNGDYTYKSSNENIEYNEEDHVIYYNNLLIAYLTEEISEQEAREIANHVEGNLVGYIKGCINMIQIQTDESELSVLNEKADSLMEMDQVFFATYDVPMEIEEDASNVENTNPWEEESDEHDAYNNDADEENPKGNDWWAESIGAYSAWEYVDTHLDNLGSITVGILDGGFDAEHEDLQYNGTSKIQFISGYEENTPSDHGTHVAGLIGAQDNNIGIRGIANNANLLCIDWNPKTNNGDDENYVNFLATGEYIEMIKQLVENDAQIINNSWGRQIYDKRQYAKITGNDIWYYLNSPRDKLKLDYENYLDAEEKLAENSTKICISVMIELLLSKKDFLIVQSAGNGYNNNKKNGYDTNLVGYFCGIDEDSLDEYGGKVFKQWLETQGISYGDIKNHILIVSGYSCDESDQIYSGFNYGENVDICAPGMNIYSTVTTKDNTEDEDSSAQYSTDSGTSMSAPIVSGAAALVWSTDSTLKAEDVKDILINTANKGSKSNKNDTRKTYPMLNLKKAIQIATSVQIKDYYEDTEYNGYTTDGQYVVVTGYDEDGQEVWTYQTETAVRTELLDSHDLGIHNNIYYLEFSGIVYAFRVRDGKLLWKTDIGGVISGYDFKEDGTLYCCGYYGPDFCTLDSEGNILYEINNFYEDYYWAYNLEYKQNKVVVTMEGTPSGEDAYIIVNLSDYSYSIDRYPFMGESEEENAYRTFLDEGQLPLEIWKTEEFTLSTYDVNQDGIKELIIHTLTPDYYQQYYFWRYESGKVKQIGKINSLDTVTDQNLYYFTENNNVSLGVMTGDIYTDYHYEIGDKVNFLYAAVAAATGENDGETVYEYYKADNMDSLFDEKITSEQWEKLSGNSEKIEFYSADIEFKYELTDEQFAQIRNALNVPDDLENVSYTVYSPYYWEGTDMWLMDIYLYEEEEFIAGAEFAVDTLEIERGIMPYQ